MTNFASNVMNNNWNWGLEEFARRCKLDPGDKETQRQWNLFQQLHRTLCAIDADVLGVIGAKESDPGVPPAAFRGLQCQIEGGQLVIRIGIDVLAQAADGLWEREGPAYRMQTTDAAKLADHVAEELVREDEQGASKLTEILDRSIMAAFEQGSEAVHGKE